MLLDRQRSIRIWDRPNCMIVLIASLYHPFSNRDLARVWYSQCFWGFQLALIFHVKTDY